MQKTTKKKSHKNNNKLKKKMLKNQIPLDMVIGKLKEDV